MKIALIGPGIMPIPPPGWGAVEILIWDYYLILRELGHDVTIINTPNTDEIVSMVNWGKFDFVHLHYDVFFHILDRLICPKIAITTHYPYIDKLEKHRMDGYARIFDFLVKQQQYYHFILADKDYKTFLNNGANPCYLYRMKNGINSNLFQFSNNAILDRTIYLGKITSRKNQAKYQLLEGVDFVGNCDDNQFDVSRSNYLGHWTREQLHNKLTNYTNLLLISDGEADPLVVKEALVSGLGVIINKSSAENLDVTKEFITILDDDKLDDIGYICIKIIENRLNCMGIRNKIREYGVINFDIVERVKTYLEFIR
jgi:hypothetical protein